MRPNRTPDRPFRPWLRSRPGRAGRGANPKLLILLAFLTGCASSGGGAPPIVANGSVPVLGAGEGLFVVHVDSEVRIERLMLSGFEVARSLPAGRHLWIVRLPSGSYEWSALELPSDSARTVRHDPADFGREDSGEFEITIEAGYVNYGGELILRRNPYSGSMDRIRLRNRNHAAMAVRSLLESHPSLLDSLPIRHAGTSGDRFLDHYSSERRRVRSRAEGAE